VIGQRLGPYRIVSEVGSGGMGTVYLAEDDAVSKVALKVVHPHLLSTPSFLRRFQREAELGLRVEHRNVVRTLDVGTEGHTHYLVMEYVEGRSLRKLLGELRTVPEALLREIASQTAAGLAAIHARGIVHRDLKPENVLITDDHRVRIMDLGVAKLQEASVALTSEGRFAGSLLYAAPEQFRSQAVGPAADLYSVGVMLYELATGLNPFRRDDTAGTIQAHLRFEPRRAADLNPEISAFLSEVLAALLAKQPEERLASAAQLRLVVDGGERSSWWAERPKALRGYLPTIQVRRETAVHGRERELAQLGEAWARAREGEGSTVLIHGEAGLGKTRLVDEFLRRLDGGDAHVLYGSYSPSGGLGGLSSAILEQFGAAGLEEALRPYLGVAPRLVSVFSALIKHESPPPGAEPVDAHALHAMLCHLLKALAEERPTLWVVEDLHNAAEESRKLVLSLARVAGSHRALFLVTARPALPQDELAHFSRLATFHRVDLGRLSPREVIELLGDAFKSAMLAEKLGGKIAYKSDGVPFFVFEMLRGLRAGHLLKQLPDGTYVQTEVIEEIEVPSAVRDLIAGRLSDVSDEDRNLLDAAAVQGFEFESDLVASVCGEPHIHVLRRLAALERRSGVARSAGRVYRFDHHQIQEVLYHGLPQELREAYHTLLAEAFAKRQGKDVSGEGALFLASHYLRGSQAARALAYLGPALDHLERGYRNDAALQLADRALEVPGLLRGAARVEILLRKCDRQALLGRYGQQKAVLEEAVGLANEIGAPLLRARTQRAWGVHLARVSDYEAALRRFTEGGSLAREAGDRKEEAHAKRNLGTVCNRLGRIEAARSHFEEALALSREIGDREGEAKSTGNLGNLFVRLGRRGEARGYFELALELCREIGDREGEATVIGNLGVVCLQMGRYSEAWQCFEHKRALCREIGYRKGEVGVLGALGAVRADLGRFPEARRLIEQYLSLSAEMGDRLEQSYALSMVGELALAEDEPEKAERAYEETLSLRRELGYASGVADALLALGRLKAERGDVEAAAAHLREALELGRDLREPNTVLLATAHRMLLPDGDVEAAIAALEHEVHASYKERLLARFLLWQATHDSVHLAEAHRLLMHLRDHAPEEDRTTLVKNVAVNRAVAAAWRDYLSSAQRRR
jgi:tetratricopeptide (TPR) repeat protein/predicted Ser/Thr protein kinase